MNRLPVRIPVGVGYDGSARLAGLPDPCASASERGLTPMQEPRPAAIPLVNVGGGPMESQFESMDFAQKILQAAEQRSRMRKEQERRKGLIDSGTVSALDLAAPDRAVNEFNQATSLLRGQHSQEAIGHLQKAITAISEVRFCPQLSRPCLSGHGRCHARPERIRDSRQSGPEVRRFVPESWAAGAVAKQLRGGRISICKKLLPFVPPILAS